MKCFEYIILLIIGQLNKSEKHQRNKAYFLDVKNSKERDILYKSIFSFGGTVNDFFSKSVKCLITDGKPKPEKISFSANSRSHRMLRISRKHETFSLVDKATAMGIEVMSTVRALQFFQNKLQETNCTKDKAQQLARNEIVHRLRHPFIKVMDKSGLYRPDYKQFKTWSTLNFESNVPESPFYTSTSNTTKLRHQKLTRARLCECCNILYSDIKEHLNTGIHKNYGKNSKNYTEIDKLISDGTSLDDFFEKAKSRNNTGNKLCDF